MGDVKSEHRVNRNTLNPKLPLHLRKNQYKRKLNPRYSFDAFPEFKGHDDFLKSNKWTKVKLILEKSNLKVHSEPLNFMADICYACYLAVNDKFVEDKLRTKYDKVIDNQDIDTLINALDMLQYFVKKVPEIGNKAFDYALQELKKNNIKISIHNESGSNYLPQLFNQYGEELKKARQYLTSSKTSKSGYREYFGGLTFPCKKPHGLDISTPQDVKKDSLLFHLVFICRHHTAGVEMPSGTGWNTMPPKKIGKPCYPLVKKIANIILYDGQETLSECAVTKCVQRLVERNIGFFEPSW